MDRRQIIEALFRKWEQYPELRLGQLLVNATSRDDTKGPCLFYLRDEHLVDMLNKFNPTRISRTGASSVKGP
jgi:hypothetical protein